MYICMLYVATFANHFWFSLPCFVLFIHSSLFTDSLESSSNHFCSDTPGLLVLLAINFSHNFGQLSFIRGGRTRLTFVK